MLENARRRGAAVAALLLTTSLTLVSCGGDDDGNTSSEPPSSEGTTTSAERVSTAPVIDPGDGGNYAPELDPANFVDTIDNPYFPLPRGARWAYEGTADGEQERIEVVVTDERKEVLGIPATVVRDTATTGGEVTEDTFDWYAQDRDGNVWYLGEDTKEYENGEVTSTEGSWEAGVDGAYAGIIMPADPVAGHSYRQEYYPGQAEDLAEIAQLGASATVPAGTLTDLLVIREWNPLEPEVVEEKYYARGVGVVLEVKTTGGEERVELTETTLSATP
jgi:hypothetical protein